MSSLLDLVITFDLKSLVLIYWLEEWKMYPNEWCSHHRLPLKVDSSSTQAHLLLPLLLLDSTLQRPGHSRRLQSWTMKSSGAWQTKILRVPHRANYQQGDGLAHVLPGRREKQGGMTSWRTENGDQGVCEWEPIKILHQKDLGLYPH
jgi:hypothetical protein